MTSSYRSAKPGWVSADADLTTQVGAVLTWPMQFASQREKSGPASHSVSQHDQPTDAARMQSETTVTSCAADVAEVLESQQPIPSEVMRCIHRMVKYCVRLHEGMVRYDDDAEKALHYAGQSPDAMTEEEQTKAMTLIQKSPVWCEIFIRLTQRSTDEMYYGNVKC